MARAIILHPGEGEVLTILNTEVRLLADAVSTEGRVGAVQHQLPRGFPGPPSHVHRSMDHLFWVVSGAGGSRLGPRLPPWRPVGLL